MFPKTIVNIFALILIFQTSFVTCRVPANESSFIFYYGPDFNDSMRYQLSEAAQILKNPHFDKNKTHLYFHGWNESQDSESIFVIVNSYLKCKDFNLIAVDWAKAAGEEYPDAAFTNLRLLGPVLADSILDLYKAGIDPKDFIVVAHSLGAQLAGVMARQVMSKSYGVFKIFYLALLDAAYPLFFPPLLQTVSKRDATFVQAIHTDIGTFGQPINLGHVDFWPNGGRQGQPGCPQGFVIPLSKEDLCSHQRSWRFWAESVASDYPKFLGFPSDSYSQFLKAGQANLRNKPEEMGINCPLSARGNYYLKTNSQSLFARGMDGY